MRQRKRGQVGAVGAQNEVVHGEEADGPFLAEAEGPVVIYGKHVGGAGSSDGVIHEDLDLFREAAPAH